MDAPSVLSNNRHSSSTIRSFNGCWTCRLRRKKCDEKRPVCDVCASLHITCHFGQEKPDWMDGGARQEDMAARLKREVKDNAQFRRREGRAVVEATFNANGNVNATGDSYVNGAHSGSGVGGGGGRRETELHFGYRGTPATSPSPSHTQTLRRGQCTLATKQTAGGILPLEESDTILLMFYIETVLPFLFPFYRPCPLQGGRAWILDMVMNSPVVRQTTLCLSQYFFSLARRSATGSRSSASDLWDSESALARNKEDAVSTLGRALQVITTSSIPEHLHGAVRIFASIMQLQRFEIMASSFDNCQTHHNAALALFQQLLDSVGGSDAHNINIDSTTSTITGPCARFYTFVHWLGNNDNNVSSPSPAQNEVFKPRNSEQHAFIFSSSLLLFEDLIASTILQTQPKLHEYHRGLLGGSGSGSEEVEGCSAHAHPHSSVNVNGIINLEAVVGCQNWVLLQISEIATLDAWKQRCKRDGSLDVMELVRRAKTIKDYLEARLAVLDDASATTVEGTRGLLDILTASMNQHLSTTTSQTLLVTRVWAHAALLYLFVVVSGWQPANPEVRYHVGRIVESLVCQISPSSLLSTVVWPFCVAGCLAEPMHEITMRMMVHRLEPPHAFGTVRKAFEIMENVWHNRDGAEGTNRDLASCFRSQADFILLV